MRNNWYGWFFCAGGSAVQVGIAPGVASLYLNTTPAVASAVAAPISGTAAAVLLPMVRGTSASDLAHSDASSRDASASRRSLPPRPDSSAAFTRLAQTGPAAVAAPAVAHSASSVASAHEEAEADLRLPMAATSSSHAEENISVLRHTRLAAAGGAGAVAAAAVVVDESHPTPDQIEVFLGCETAQAGRSLTESELRFLSGFSNNQIEARREIRAALEEYERSRPGSIKFKLVVQGGLIVRRKLKRAEEEEAVAEPVNEYLPLGDYNARIIKAADYINQKEKDKNQIIYLRVFQVPMSEPAGSKLGDFVSVSFCGSDGIPAISFVLCKKGKEIIVIEDSVYDDLCVGDIALEDCVDAATPVPAVASAAAAAAPAPSVALEETVTGTAGLSFSTVGSSSARRPPPLSGRALGFLCDTRRSGHQGGSGSTGGGAAGSRCRVHSSMGSPLVRP